MKTITRVTLLQRLAQCLLVGSLLAFADSSLATERVTYYHNDALGSPVAATDANGTLLWREEYAPYGERLKKEAGSKDTIWYTGKQEESTFGLSYFGARWYDPRVGRFMGVDSAGFDEDNIHSYSKYAYANNNPYKFVDPDGMEALYGVSLEIAALQGRNVETVRAGQKEFGKFVLGAAAVAIVSIASYNTLGPVAAEVLLVGTTGEAAISVSGKFSRTPKSIQDQMTLDAAKQGQGKVIIDSLNDPKFKGIQKLQLKTKSAQGRDSVVNFVRDKKTGNLMDFKFKKHSTDGIAKHEK